MYKLFLTIRYLRKRRIAYFAIAAVMLCTMMVLVVASVMGGFLDQVKRKARGLLGDIVMDNGSPTRGFPLYEELLTEIKTWPEIKEATPIIYGFGMLRFVGSSRVHPVQVVGIRLQEAYAVNAFKQSLYYERYYPGTTTLAEQQQPVLGWDESSPPAPDRPGYVLPVLPEPFRAARARTLAEGLLDVDESRMFANAVFKDLGFKTLPGVWALNETQGSDPTTQPALPPPALIGDPRPGLIIGRDLVAERLPAGNYSRFEPYIKGGVATLALVPLSRSGMPDTPIQQVFRYTDDSRMGIYEIDSKQVYCDFDLLQRCLWMDDYKPDDPKEARIRARASQIQIKAAPKPDGEPLDSAEMDELAARISARYHEIAGQAGLNLSLDELALATRVRVVTWEQSQAHIIAPVERERVLVTILFSLISLVASVLVLCILYMIVLQKTRDIGIIKSIGGSSAGVAAIFITYGAAVGTVGSIIGAVLGALLVRNINAIQEFLIRIHPGMRVWDRAVYSFDEIPNTVRTEDVIVVVLLAIITSTLGSVAAAWRAGTMQPVEALRYE